MRRDENKVIWGALALSGVLVICSGGTASAQHSGGGHPTGGHVPMRQPSGGAHQHFDSRFSHNQYYYNHGYALHRPPPGALGEFHDRDGGRYWYHRGNWYRYRGGWYRWWGGAWVVWGPPIGLFVPILPPYFTTIWWGGIPYYYANDTYYLWVDARQQYEVVEPPTGIESGGSTRAPLSNQLFVYPKSGQSAEQQSKDRYECHRWAVSQSGYDPTAAGGGVPPQDARQKRDDYFRAEAGCLEGRGYTVK